MSESPNYRMAALKLHSLHPKDRKWLLKQFEPNQQQILRDLIIELRNLGLVSTVKITDNFTPYPVGMFTLDEHVVAEINRVELDGIKKALSTLPDRMKVIILHASHWDWACAFWLSLQQQERDRLLKQFDQCKAIKPLIFLELTATFASMLDSTTHLNSNSRFTAHASQISVLDT